MLTPIFALRKAHLLLLSLSFVFLTGCQESLLPAPETTDLTPALSSGPGYTPPANACGSATGLIRYQGTTTVGNAEIMNDETDLYVLMSMNSGFFIEKVYAYLGDASNVPASNGQIALEELPYVISVSGGSPTYTLQASADGYGSCDEVVVALLISQRDMFGNIVQTNLVWLDGNSLYDGYSKKYCLGTC